MISADVVNTVDTKRIAKRYYLKRHCSRRTLEEFEQDALIGLMQATREYNSELGDFRAFAVKCIQNQITDSDRADDHLPKRTRAAVKRNAIDSIPAPGCLSEATEPFAEPARHECELFDSLNALLDPSEVKLLKLKYCYDLTDEEIAGILGVYRQRATEQIAAVHEKLKGLGFERLRGELL